MSNTWDSAFWKDRRSTFSIMFDLADKMNNKIKLNRSDLRKFTKYHCFTFIMCESINPHAVSECPLTDKQCLRLIELYNKYIS